MPPCSALRLRMADALVVVAAGERPAERKLAWHALALVAKQVLPVNSTAYSIALLVPIQMDGIHATVILHSALVPPTNGSQCCVRCG